MRDERTLKMMEGLINDRRAGLTNTEIAKKYEVSKKTLLNCLSEIAEVNGISRESLLDKAQPKRGSGEKKSSWAKKIIPTKDFLESAKDAIDRLHKVNEEMIATIKEQEVKMEGKNE